MQQNPNENLKSQWNLVNDKNKSSKFTCGLPVVRSPVVTGVGFSAGEPQQIPIFVSLFSSCWMLCGQTDDDEEFDIWSFSPCLVLSTILSPSSFNR